MESQPLSIAINAQLVSVSSNFRNAGVSRYTFTLLTGLCQMTRSQHYTAFVNAGEATGIASSSLGGHDALELVPSGGTTSKCGGTHPMGAAGTARGASPPEYQGVSLSGECPADPRSLRQRGHRTRPGVPPLPAVLSDPVGGSTSESSPPTA